MPRSKTLLEKFSMLVSANLSELVGPFTERPKGGIPVTVEGYIRRIEREIYGIDKAAHEMISQVRTMHDRLNSYERQARELDRAVDMHLTRGNDAAALLAQKKLNRLQPRLVHTLDDIKEWESRLLVLKEKRDRLEILLTDAKQKEKTQQNQTGAANARPMYWVID